MGSTTSYSSRARGVGALAREVSNLVSGYKIELARVEHEPEDLRHLEEVIERETGLRIRDLDVLDVGAGQFLLQMAYFAARNRVVGIDLNVIVQGFDPIGYWRMLCANGPMRVLKTLGRKTLRIDHRYRTRFLRSAALRRFPRLTVLQMDAASLAFPSESFDFAYSLLVFQHVADPLAAALEMARVLRPGGVACVTFTLYTGPTGALDVRALAGSAQLLPWAHLRRGLQYDLQESGYVNGIRLPEWRRIFEDAMPGAKMLLHQPDAPRYGVEAQRLRESRELVDYSLEELLTTSAMVVWRKPDRADAAR